MSQFAPRNRLVTLAVGTALAAVLAGCTTSNAPRADLSASKAQNALVQGQADEALNHAEAAVLAEPRNASYRTMLGASYMEAGRFQSAASSFNDAMTLGDTSTRTALSLALAQIASGDFLSARGVLNDYRDAIDPADLGLALALAGDTGQGIEVLTHAVRSGQNTAKVRQNLAYALALKGDWRSARIMAAEDVPADQINNRIAEWASTAAPGHFHHRVAKLLEVPLVNDGGMPARLALANTPGSQEMIAEAVAELPAAGPSTAPYMAANGSRELPALAHAPVAAIPVVQAAPAPAAAIPTPATPVRARTAPTVAGFERAFVAPAAAPVRPSAVRAPAPRAAVAAPAPRAQPVSAPRIRAASGGDHMVQLGSFSNRESAQRAVGIYAKRFGNLDQDAMVITEARVNGKTYWRVSAGDMARNEAQSMCSTVKARGFGCIAYAAKRPLPGAVDSRARMASR